MTFTVEAIREMQESHVVEQANCEVRLMSGCKSAVVALPDSYSTHDLEKFLPLRRRARGRMSTTSVRDFAAYTSAHREPGASVFIDAAKMRAVGVLNLGLPLAPGHADNLAVLELEQTAAYKAMRFACNSHKSQATLAEFLEDWLDAVEAFANSEQITAPKAIRCVPYAGLAERNFVLRLAIHTGDKAPQLSLRIVNEELHAEQMAQELCQLLRTTLELPAYAGEIPLPVLIGSYAAAA